MKPLLPQIYRYLLPLIILISIVSSGNLITNRFALMSNRGLAPNLRPTNIDSTTGLYQQLDPDAKRSGLHSYWYSQLLFKEKRTDQSITTLKDLLQERPIDLSAYLYLAQIYFSEGQTIEGIEANLEFLKRVPDSAEGIENLNRFYQQWGEHSLATPTQLLPNQSENISLKRPIDRPFWLILALAPSETRPPIEIVNEEAIQVSVNQVPPRFNRIGFLPNGTAGIFYLFDQPLGTDLNIEATNRSETQIDIDSISVELVTNFENFFDIIDPGWTDTVHKSIGQVPYVTYLSLPEGNNQLVLGFFDQPGSSVAVFIEDKQVGEVIGGQRGTNKGGWTPFTFELENGYPDLVKVKIQNSSEAGIGSNTIYFQKQD